jgi:hypothetical protein
VCFIKEPHPEPLHRSGKALVQFAGHVEATSVSIEEQNAPMMLEPAPLNQISSPIGPAITLDVYKTFVVNLARIFHSCLSPVFSQHCHFTFVVTYCEVHAATEIVCKD